MQDRIGQGKIGQDNERLRYDRAFSQCTVVVLHRTLTRLIKNGGAIEIKVRVMCHKTGGVEWIGERDYISQYSTQGPQITGSHAHHCADE